MKKYVRERILVCALAAMATASLGAVTSYAEGSKELIQYGGNRPFLEWQSANQMTLPRTAVIYAYVKAGETVSFASSVPYANSASINAIAEGLSDKLDNSRADGDTVSENQIPNGDGTYPSIAVIMPSDDNGTAFDPSKTSSLNFKYNTASPSKDDLSSTIYFYGYNINTNDDGTYAENEGFISNVTKESEKSYSPVSFTAPVTGTYAFRFLSMKYENEWPIMSDVSDDFYRSSSKEYSQRNSSVAAWDITVKDSSGNVQNGRAWTDMLFMNMGGNSDWKDGSWTGGLKSNLYVLTNDGFEYQVNFNGIDPFGFAFYSNRRGLLLDEFSKYTNSGDTSNVKPLLHSIYSADDTDNTVVGSLPVKQEYDDYGAKSGVSPILANLTAVDKDKDSTHRIFFNIPSSDAVKAYTKNGELIDAKGDIAYPESNDFDFSFIGAGTGADNSNGISYGTKGSGGQFEVVIPESAFSSLNVSSFRIALDFSGYALNEDGVPKLDDNNQWTKTDSPTSAEENNKVLISNSITDENGAPIGTVVDRNGAKAYKYTFSWDGRDAYGNIVPAGEYGSAVKASWEIGSAHFPLLDVENMENGIKVKRLNFEDENADVVYYNNEASPEDGSSTAWYFKKAKKDTVSVIADGRNAINGISTNFDDSTKSGVMSYDKKRGDRTLLDMWSSYTLDTNKSIKIGINEPDETNEEVSDAYVSFVAENGTTSLPQPFDKSHVKYGSTIINDFSTTGNSGNTKLYGNTISTGFTAKYQKKGSDSSSQKIVFNWDITIPNDGTYIKLNDSSNPLMNVNDSPILSDSEDIINKGSIYKTSQSSGSTIKLTYDTGVIITGTADISIVTGLVIDNLYAPNASAVISHDDNADGYTSIKNTAVDADSLDIYKNNSGNEYNLQKGDK